MQVYAINVLLYGYKLLEYTKYKCILELFL